MIDGLINVFLLLLILTVLVLLHELGHFVVARRAGVIVHEFGIGFPPRARVLFKRGDTTYTLNWLPIGGFVRMEGEEVSPADGTEPEADAELGEETEHLEEVESLDPRAFVNQKLGTRLRILGAGIVVNFVIAWILFTFIALFAQPIWQVQLANVSADSPAERVGLIGGQLIEHRLFTVTDENDEPTGEVIAYAVYDDSGDKIVAIDGQAFPFFDDMANADAADRRIAPIQYLADRPSQTVMLTVEHADGAIEQVEVTLRSAEEIEAGLGALGFQPGDYTFGEQKNGIGESVVIGFERTVETSTLILRTVVGIFLSVLDGPGDALKDVAGPLGMVDFVGQVRTSLPPVFLVWFAAMLSANLAVFNLLPIPPLDGSRMVMGTAQAASGNRIRPETERLIYFTGWVALMVFLVLVTFSDIQRWLS
ncbi:MAG: M50 family metallopeptidase [Chloroflexota bacterium]|nr:M50 family metallopeptidase [Chloroflexota bacterium]